MGSSIESVLRQALTQVRVFLTAFIQMFGAQYQFLLIAMLNTSSVSLMTTLERYGFIFIKHKFDVFGIFKKWKAQVEN